MGFTGLVSAKRADTIVTTLTDLDDTDLMPGDVTIDVEYSTINFKDAMAISGRAAVIETFPLIPGIDLAGTVSASDTPEFAVGDRVIGQRMGSEPESSRRVRAARTGSGIVGRAAPGPVLDSGCDGGGHSGVHRDAECDGARTRWA